MRTRNKIDQQREHIDCLIRLAQIPDPCDHPTIRARSENSFGASSVFQPS